MFDVLKSKHTSIEFQSPVQILKQDELYKGTDSIMTNIGKMLSMRCFESSFIFRAPQRIGCRWKAEISNLLQAIIGKSEFLSLSPSEIKFHDDKAREVFEHSKILLTKLTENHLASFVRLGVCHYKGSHLVCKNTYADTFDTNLDITRLYRNRFEIIF